MATVLKKEWIYQLIFFACIAVPYLNQYEATFAVWGLTVLLTLRKRYSFTIVHYISCFIAIFLVAFTVTFFKNPEPYEFIRDFAYLLKPILGLFIGYQLCKDYIKNPLMMLINTAFVIAIIHLVVIGHTIVFKHVRNMHVLRMYSGYFSDFEVYGIIILLFRKELGLHISKLKFQIILPVIIISVFFYLARTNFIQFAILFMALKGYFVINKRSIVVVGSAILLVGAGYAAIYSYNPQRNSKGFEAFLYKVKNAPIEPFKTKVNREDWKDFHDNYRSYENISTMRQMTSKGTETILFGEGMGSSIDLRRKVWLQSSFMRYIPFLHNGFMTIFLKSGLLGNLILIYSIALMFKHRKSDITVVKNINYILLGTGVFLIISYWVFMGLYFTVDTKSVVIGFLLRYRENLIKSANMAGL